ncbi:MAG: hypothetical protein J0H74_14240 [Chitinophagaceae bacterium]|nr:hypothetical protein [Chitinophagaceae bacterium]
MLAGSRIPMIPVDDFPIPPYRDPDVIRAWEWFISLLPLKKWQARKASIEERITVNFKPTPPFSEPFSNGTKFSVKEDQIGWYLYLLETLIKEPHKYEFVQGSRVIPIFKRLGMDLPLLKEIKGVALKVKKLINKRPSEADAILFELLTALLWARNGWRVDFIEEDKNAKTPDFVARKGNEEWYVECKRQSKTSDYAEKERLKWQAMISHINKDLIEQNLLLNTVFHVELSSLPDTFLKDTFASKLPFIVQPGTVVSNEYVDIDVSFIDIPLIKQHLRRYFVKYPSPQMAELIGNKPIDNLGFASGMKADFIRVGSGPGNNLYVRDIDQAYGAFWRCDAREAILAKARDIKMQLVSALEQFQPEQNVVIHIGIETYEGPIVEQERLLKITDTLDRIELNGKKLKWAYCHFFQAYSHASEIWTFDETVNMISSNPPSGLPPLVSKFLVIPEDDSIDNLAHWERPLP